MKIQNVKGGYDFLPNEQKIRDYINSVIIKNFKQYGFKSIETPILCYYDVLADKYDEENDILKEIYKLSDQGGRNLGLRYDLTVPFAKFIALNKNNITFPFKRYEISKVFRDGPVKVGRDREFTQCDADVVGIDGQIIEAELLSLYVKTFKELNIDVVIYFNNRKLMKGLILESGIKNELVSEVTTILDKMNKVTKEELIQMLVDLDISLDNINKLFKYFEMTLNDLSSYFNDTNNILIKEGLNEVICLKETLDSISIGEYCEFDITLARGQNYYTGNVFEVYDKQRRVSGSIGGGGRYDNMIKEFIGDGNDYPTVGISFGLSSIYEILKSEINNNESDTLIYIIPIDIHSESLVIANKLRCKGYIVEMEMSNRKLRKSLDYANKWGIKYVIIIGKDELQEGQVSIKNMITGDNILVNINEISNYEF